MSAKVIRAHWLGEPKELPAQREDRHAEAFRALEPLINDVDRMARLAMRAGIRADGSEPGSEEQAMATFTVCHLQDITADLRAEYYRLFRDDDQE
jgi:hypothetical protein